MFSAVSGIAMSPLVLLALHLVVAVTASGNCGAMFDDNGVCACSLRDASTPVTCLDDNQVRLKPCYCMYYDASQNMSILGHCIYSCIKYVKEIEIASSAEFNTDICNKFYGTHYRTGQFCG